MLNEISETCQVCKKSDIVFGCLFCFKKKVLDLERKVKRQDKQIIKLRKVLREMLGEYNVKDED